MCQWSTHTTMAHVLPKVVHVLPKLLQRHGLHSFLHMSTTCALQFLCILILSCAREVGSVMMVPRGFVYLSGSMKGHSLDLDLVNP